MRKSADTDYSRLFASPATSREVQDLSTRGIEVTVPFFSFCAMLCVCPRNLPPVKADR